MEKISVLGIGNAIVDIISNVEESFLTDCNLEKGTMKLVCEEEASFLYSQVKAKKIISGGSVANTIAGLAALGNKVAFIGKVSEDDLGAAFEKELKELGVIFKTRKAPAGELFTGRCIVLTTPDAQRTMNTCLGIAGMISPEDIDENLIKVSCLIYVEGYLLDQPIAKNAVEKTVAIAKKNGLKVAVSLSDKFCVDRNRQEFLMLLEDYASILFANESEILELFKCDDFDYVLKKCREFTTIFVITRSEKGSVIISAGKTYKIPVEKTVVIDSTGAGDMYAAGFLNGFIKGYGLKKSGRMGSIVASEAISHFGARPQRPLIELLVDYGL